MSILSKDTNQIRDSDSRNTVVKQCYLMGYTNKQLQPLVSDTTNHKNYIKDIARFIAGLSKYDGIWYRFVNESSKSIPNVKTLMEQIFEKLSSNDSMTLEQFRKVFDSVLENELASGKYWPQQLIDLVHDLLADPSEASFLLAHLVARAVWDLQYEKVPLLEVQVDQFNKALEFINQTGSQNQQFEPQDVFKNLHSINIFNKFFRQLQQEEQQQQEQQEEQEEQEEQEQQRFLEQQINNNNKINNIANEMCLTRAFEELDRSRSETLEFYFATKKMIFATDSLLETINTSKEAIFNVSAAKSLIVFVTTPKNRYGILAGESREDKLMGDKVDRFSRDHSLRCLCTTELATASAKSVENKGGAVNDVAECLYEGHDSPIPISGNHRTAIYSAGEKLERGKNASACPFTVDPYTPPQKKNKSSPQLSLVRADGSDSCFSLPVNNKCYHFDPDVFGGKTGGGSDVLVAVSLEHHHKVEQTVLANKRAGRACVVMCDLNSNKLGVKNGKSYLTNEKSKDFQKYGKDCVVCNRDDEPYRCVSCNREIRLKYFFLATHGTDTVNCYGFKLTFALKPVKNTFDPICVPANIDTNHHHVAVAEVHYVLERDDEAKRLEADEKKINEFFTKLGE